VAIGNRPFWAAILQFPSARRAGEENLQKPERIHWWPILQQSFCLLVFEHAFRAADDPFLRYLVWHKPFWHDWAASGKHYELVVVSGEGSDHASRCNPLSKSKKPG
jgi:hypothetical protein